MTFIFKALCWSAAILGVAVAGAVEIIDEASATTLLISLPVVAWLSLQGRLCCFAAPGARS